MANKYLSAVYNQIFGKIFDYGEFDNRLEMQKVIYMLQELGAPIGNYGFRWYKHGPYSQELLDDMYVISPKYSNNISFSVDTQKSIQSVKNIIDVGKDSTYGSANWSECVASILYLRKYVFPSSTKESCILEELKERKPHLSDDALNQQAYNLVSECFTI